MHKAPQSEVREGKKMKPVLIIECKLPLSREAWEAFYNEMRFKYSESFQVVVIPHIATARVAYKENISPEYLEVHEMD